MTETVDWAKLKKQNSNFKFEINKHFFLSELDVSRKDGYKKQLHVMLPEGDETFVGTLAGLCKYEFNFFDLNIEDGDNIIDLGCNYGLISIVCAALYPNCTVHSFDPCVRALETLRLNCFINNIQNIKFYNTAVTASEDATLKFSSNLSQGESCFIESDLNDESHEEIGEFKNTHIKTVLNNINNISYLKVDIEGSEYGIFNYLFEHNRDFSKNIKRVHIEVHGEKTQREQLIKKLKTHFPSEENIIVS